MLARSEGEAMRLGRYDNPYKCVSYASIDPDVRQEALALEAEDGGLSSGILYTKGRHQTAVCFMHPKADMSRHYAIPALLDAGYAAFGQNSRWLNNDEMCVHENLLLDVAAGVRFLRSRGFKHVVVCGNSGGGSLYAFYVAQSVTAAPNRLTHTPAGDPLDLNGFDLPPVDGYVNLAAHLGEGKILMQMIDPSVTDENDPLSCNPTLDPFRPENGYRHPPESSRYAADFVARYRAGQRARVERLDAIARAHLQRRREARAAMAARDFAARGRAEQVGALRGAVSCRYMVVYRTEADVRAFDLSLDPSDRNAGSLFSYRPDLTNYMEFGFARVQTPRAWLSTWSGLSSNADVACNAAKITVPSLVVYYTGDNAIFPSDARTAYAAIASSDKQIHAVPGDHYGFAVGTQDRRGAPIALTRVAEWLRERFPA
jgi:pimeloyl-ACP methyl ester carboxylesterase